MSAQESGQVVFVVDDDPATLEIVGTVLRARGHKVETYLDAEQFLGAFKPNQRGCLVVDVRMPGMDGLTLHGVLRKRGIEIPTVVITSHATVKLAVDGMKQGVYDFLEKPLIHEQLVRVVEDALALDGVHSREQANKDDIRARFGLLTPREREIMLLLTDGNTNKAIAARLGISVRTVELHRARVMAKSRARTVAELVRMALATETA
ncbi:MAG: response regulator transcription factor [Alphaproteobacteria bacterium]|nr:response regulator transcription factor [Alphaproteobacteria bacterium]